MLILLQFGLAGHCLCPGQLVIFGGVNRSGQVPFTMLHDFLLADRPVDKRTHLILSLLSLKSTWFFVLCRAWRQIFAWNRFLLRRMCSVRVHAVLAAMGAAGRPCLLPLVPLGLQESFAGRVFLAEIAAVPGWVPRSLAVS